MTTQKKKSMTVTEIMLIKQARYGAYMNWKMAKALVDGHVDSSVLRWAEIQYKSQKDIFTKEEL